VSGLNLPNKINPRFKPIPAALNRKEVGEFLAPFSFAPNFKKLLGPQSMGLAPQTREEWYEDLTTGFVGQNYKEWEASILGYWEDTGDRSAVVLCREKGTLVTGEEYLMDYFMKYKFDEDGKLEELYEHTDSDLQKRIAAAWVKRMESEEKK